MLYNVIPRSIIVQIDPHGTVIQFREVCFRAWPHLDLNVYLSKWSLARLPRVH